MAGDLRADLRAVLGEAGLLTGAEAMAPYLREWRGRFASEALAVARPADTGQASKVVAACARAGTAIVPQGGNTGLVGGAVARAGQILLSLDRMTAVRALDADNNTMTVEAGCVLANAQAAAAEAGRLFPLSLAAEGSATVGGNLATNAGGVNVLRYGNARDLALGLEVVLADGRVWDGLNGLRKNNAGYDLKQLFIGSEGTLGVITAAVLKLFPALAQRETAFVGIRDPAAGLRLLHALQRGSGDNLIACELIPRLALELVCKHIPGTRDPLAAPQPWYVLVELGSPAPGAWLREALEGALSQALAHGDATDAGLAANLAQAGDFWRLRESIPEAQTREGASIKHDVAVSVSQLPAFVEDASAAVAACIPGVRVCAFGHLGDGNLHFNLSAPAGAQADEFMAQREAVNRVVHDLVARYRGSFAAEHGIGRLKPAELARYASPVGVDVMRRIKAVLDPAGLLNPGAVLPP